MTTKRNVTIAFLVFLTLSIGIISANSITKLVYAQSNALAQKGNSQVDQIKEQLQSSTQDNQVVSGDTSILSGNNLQCQNQDNSKEPINDNGLCNEDIKGTVGQSYLEVTTAVCGRCTSAVVTITDSTGSESYKVSSADESTPHIFTIPVNEKYTVTVEVTLFPQRHIITFDPFSSPEYCKQINTNSCTGMMGYSPQFLLIQIERR